MSSNTDTAVVQELAQVLNTWVASSRNAEITEIFRTHRDEIVFTAGSNEMLRIDHSGFWVREQLMPTDNQEAASVYAAFREWLVWAQLNRL